MPSFLFSSSKGLVTTSGHLVLSKMATETLVQAQRSLVFAPIKTSTGFKQPVTFLYTLVNRINVLKILPCFLGPIIVLWLQLPTITPLPRWPGTGVGRRAGVQLLQNCGVRIKYVHQEET